jgi:hypothetical protein
MKSYFLDKRVLITGASQGIGKQLALDFAREGAICILVARSLPALEENRMLLSHPEKHFCFRCDVARRSEVHAMSEGVRTEAGPLDILINNAGISRYHTFLESPLEDLEALMQTNYWGMVYCTREFLPGMLERGSGHIVNLSSIAGRIGTLRHTGYSASKFAVSGFSESLYYELLETGVKITLVNPGVFDTHLFDHSSFSNFPESQRRMMKPPSLVSHAILDAIRKGRFEITVPRFLWAGVWVKAIWPSLFQRLHTRFLRKGGVIKPAC